MSACGNDGLAQGNAAVVWCDQVVAKDLEPRAKKSLFAEAKEELVLEATAREGDGPDARLFRQMSTGLHDHGGKASVKVIGQSVHVPAGQALPQQPAHEFLAAQDKKTLLIDLDEPLSQKLDQVRGYLGRISLGT